MQRCPVVVSLLVLAGLFASSPVGAQIVNVLPMTAEAEEGFGGGVEGGADWRTGNTELLLLSGKLQALWRKGDHLALALARGEFGLSRGETIVSNQLEHLRYRTTLPGPWALETFVQHDANRFRRLALRALVGAGPRVEAIDADHVRLYFGLAVMLEHERLGDETGNADASEETTVLRASSYLVFELDLGERLRFAQTTYAQPRLDAPGDIRILSDWSLQTLVRKHLTFKTTFLASYDSEPPESVQGLDTRLVASLALAF